MQYLEHVRESAMGVLDANSCPSNVVNDQLDKFWTETYNIRTASKIYLPINCTNEELLALNQEFAPLMLQISQDTKYDNGHFYQNTAHFLAEQYLDKFDCLEIGANFKKVLDPSRTKHFCNLIHGRDQGRIISCIAEQQNLDIKTGINLYHMKDCSKGAENCIEPSFTLKANNVIYDITPATMYKIFKNHKSYAGYFSILLPKEVIMGVEGTNTRLRYHISHEGKETSMNFFDQSHGYTHDSKTWRDWAILDGYEGRDFNLTFERYRKFGNLFIIRILRVTKSFKLHHFDGAAPLGFTAIIDTLPVLREMSKYIHSHFSINKSVIKKWKNKCRTLYLPTELVEKAHKFLWNRTDADINRNHAGAILTASSTQIKISDFMIQYGVDLTNKDFDAIAMSLFIGALIKRAMSSKETSYFIKKLHQDKATMWEKIKNDLKVIFEPMLPSIISDADAKNIEAVYGLTPNHMAAYSFILGSMTQFKDYVHTTEAKDHSINSVSIPKTKNFTYKPPSDGFCYMHALQKLTLHCFFLGSDPTITQIEQALNMQGFTVKNADPFVQIPIEFQDDSHAIFKCDTENFCRHSVPFRPFCIPQSTGRFSVNSQMFDNTQAYLDEDELNTNCAKTLWVLENLYTPANKHIGKFLGIDASKFYIREKKKKVIASYDSIINQLNVDPLNHDLVQSEELEIHSRTMGVATFNKIMTKISENTQLDTNTIINLASAPFNDELVWLNVQTKTFHNVVTTQGVEYNMIPNYEGHEFVFNYNACCNECMSQLPDSSFIYADIGNNMPTTGLPNFYRAVLLNLISTGKQFAVKVNHIDEIINGENCDEFIEIMITLSAYKESFFASGEIILSNVHYLRPPHSQKRIDESKGFNGVPWSHIVKINHPGGQSAFDLEQEIYTIQGLSKINITFEQQDNERTGKSFAGYFCFSCTSYKPSVSPCMNCLREICNDCISNFSCDQCLENNTGDKCHECKTFKTEDIVDCSLCFRKTCKFYCSTKKILTIDPIHQDDPFFTAYICNCCESNEKIINNDGDIVDVSALFEPDLKTPSAPPAESSDSEDEEQTDDEESSADESDYQDTQETLSEEEEQSDVRVETNEVVLKPDLVILKEQLDILKATKPQFDNFTINGHHKLRFDEESDATYQNVDKLPDSKEIKIIGCNVSTALILTSRYEIVYYRAKHFSDTIFSNEGLFDLPNANEPLPIYTSPFYGGKQCGDINDFPKPFAIFRGDIPNLMIMPDLTGIYQICDVDSGCNKCSLTTFDGKIVGVKDNTIFGPKNEIKIQQFKEFTISEKRTVLDHDYNLLFKELKDTKGVFADCHHEASIVVKNTRWHEQIKLKIVEGTAASGKSAMCKKVLKNIISLVICPTSELAKEYRDDGFDAVSWAQGISACKDKVVLIDEVYCLPLGVVWQICETAKEVYSVGDRHQMEGGGKDSLAIMPTLASKISYKDINKRMVSFTVPHDIINAVNTHIPDPFGKMLSQSRVINSVVFKTGEPPKVCQKKIDRKDKGVCSNKHAFKKLCIQGACFDKTHANRMNYPTVAQIQGKRAINFNLFLSSNCGPLLDSVHGQKFVAITRHTKTMTIFQSVPSLWMKLGVMPLIPQHACGIGRRDAHRTTYGANNDIINGLVFTTNVESVVPEEPNLTMKPEEIEGIRSAEAKVISSKPFILNHLVTGKTRVEKLKSMPDVHEYRFGTPISYSINQNLFTGYESLHMNDPGVDDFEPMEYEQLEVLLRDKIRTSSLMLGSTVQASEIIQSIVKTTSQVAEPHRYVIHTDMKKLLPGKKLTFSQHKRVLAQETSKNTFLPLSPSFGMMQENTLNHQVHTMVMRYGSNVQEIEKGQAAHAAFLKLKNGFEKFVNMSNIRKMTIDEIALKELSALQKIMAKDRYPDLGPFGESYESTIKISAFNKQQLKSKIGDEAWLNGKVENGKFHVKGGQPVSAQAKTVNQIAMKYILMAEEIIMQNCKPGVHFGYGKSQIAFRQRVSRRLQEKKHKKAKTVSADITEQDTNKAEWTNLFMRWIYDSCGVPELVIEIIEKLNIDWALHATDAFTRVKHRYQSGRADTIFANTCMDIGVVGQSFLFDEIIIALFQGDDACLRATNLRPSPDFYNKLKVDYNPVGDFIGYLVGEKDIYLDLPRMAAKNLTRMIGDIQTLENYKIATGDLLKLHTSFEGRQANFAVVGYKYKISTVAAEQLYDYLDCFARGDIIKDFKCDKFGKRKPEYVAALALTLKA